MTNNTSTKKQTLFLIGGSGLVGSRLVELLKESYLIETAGISSGFDITDPQTLSSLKNSQATIVLHLAAKTDVDGCEAEKDLGENGESFRINVHGAKNVADVCRETGKKMIYFSTDFVFDGVKEPPYEYRETDSPNPINWYAQTKFEGEKIVQSTVSDSVILRIAYPYRAVFEKKKDFVRIIKERLEEGREVNAVTDHIMSPTFIDDIAVAVDVCIRKSVTGIVHAVGGSYVTPFEACMAIAQEFNLDRKYIRETTRVDFFQGRAKRPFNLALKNDTLHRLGVVMHSFKDGLALIHKELELS